MILNTIAEIPLNHISMASENDITIPPFPSITESILSPMVKKTTQVLNNSLLIRHFCRLHKVHIPRPTHFFLKSQSEGRYIQK